MVSLGNNRHMYGKHGRLKLKFPLHCQLSSKQLLDTKLDDKCHTMCRNDSFMSCLSPIKAVALDS